MSERRSDLSCLVMGSFKFKPLIDQTIDEFERLRVNVLAPKKGNVVAEVQGVKVLEGDDTTDVIALETAFLRPMCMADFLYVVAKDGYIGMSAFMEARWNILVWGKRMFSSEPITRIDEFLGEGYLDWVVRNGEITVATPQEAVERTKKFKRKGVKRGFLPLYEDPWMKWLKDHELWGREVVAAEGWKGM